LAAKNDSISSRLTNLTEALYRQVTAEAMPLNQGTITYSQKYALRDYPGDSAKLWSYCHIVDRHGSSYGNLRPHPKFGEFDSVAFKFLNPPVRMTLLEKDEQVNTWIVFPEDSTFFQIEQDTIQIYINAAFAGLPNLPGVPSGIPELKNKKIRLETVIRDKSTRPTVRPRDIAFEFGSYRMNFGNFKESWDGKHLMYDWLISEEPLSYVWLYTGMP
jgi:hypothetical protein